MFAKSLSWVALAVASNLLGAPAFANQEASKRRPLTVEAALGMRQVLAHLDGEPVSMSPDGTRYVVRLVRDDVARGGVLLEVMSGRVDTFAHAGTIETIATLFTTAESDWLTGRLPTIHPAMSHLVWLDNERVAFLWNDGRSPTQILTVNVRSKQVSLATSHVTSVQAFTSGGGGGSFIYLASPELGAEYQKRMVAMMREGFAMPGPNAIETVLAGRFDGFIPWNNYEVFVAQRSGFARKVSCHKIHCGWLRETPERFSPDGRYSIFTHAPAAALSEEWHGYASAELRKDLAIAQLDATDLDRAARIGHLGLLDVDRGEMRPLWDVPRTIYLPQTSVVWSPDSRRVLIGPTFLPLAQADAAGLAGTAVADVDVRTGRFRSLPIPPDQIGKVRPVTWSSGGIVELSDGHVRLQFRDIRGKWVPAAEPSRLEGKEAPVPVVRIELREGPNTPPALYAVDVASGRERVVLDVEPRLRTDYVLGRVENVSWSDFEGRIWKGTLYYPAGYTPGRRHAFTIQFPDSSPSRIFSLSGAGRGRGAVFAAQMLANRDMAVLSLESHADVSAVIGTPDEAELIRVGAQAAIDHFVNAGLVDRGKVGLIGFSRSGWHVQYIVSHSTQPIGAAVAADNIDSSYVQNVLLGGMGGWSARQNGGDPFGAGLTAWLDRALGFNAHNVRSPLRLEVDTGGVAALPLAWEMYSQLHQLKKPVELVMVPDSEAASHPLQMPNQKRFSQEGTVDWMDFWLNGREDPDPRKAEQYRRWRVLREQQQRVIEERRAAGDMIPDL